MKRKILSFFTAFMLCLSVQPVSVFADETPEVNDAVDMETDSKMPVIKDDTGTITEEMKARLIAKFVKEFPDEDLSDFTVEYSSNDNSNFDNPSGDYRFNVFYKDVLIYDEIGSNSRVFLGIRSDEDYEAVFKPEFVETCKGLELDNLIGEEAAKQVLKDAHKLSDNDNCDIQLVIYNYLTTGMMGSDKAALAYKVDLTSNHPDMEYIIDAHSGEIIKGESSVVPSQDKRYKINEVTYLIHDDWAEVESCEVTVQGQKVVIPEEINGVPVTKIGTAAFNDCVIQEIVIPETVVEIGDGAFEFCSYLETVKLPSNLKKIKFATFQSSGIKEIVIPESVTEIEGTAFDGCDNLETITIPKNVETIGKCAFSHSRRLKEILVEDGNAYFSSVDGVLFNYDKTELIAYPGGKPETSYSIPESVKTISGGTYGGAFAGSLNLTEVNIPEGVEVIESNVFTVCPKLLQLKLPSTVQKLEESVICRCLSLSAVYIPKSVTEIGEGVFERCDALTDIYYEGSESDWEAIVKADGWSTQAVIHYNAYDTESLLGDVNLDGAISAADAVMLQKWLVKSGDIKSLKNADMNSDRKINVFDLCLIKRKLIYSGKIETPANMPAIVDDYYKVTDAMRSMLWETVETKYPNVDFSDFTFVYEPEHRLMNHSDGLYFSIYYKDILLHGYGNINTYSNVYASIKSGNTVELEMVVDPTLYSEVNLDEQCISKEDVKAILEAAGRPAPEPELIIFIDFQDKKSLKLAYKAENDDFEDIIDAVTGEIIAYIPYTVF